MNKTDRELLILLGERTKSIHDTVTKLSNVLVGENGDNGLVDEVSIQKQNWKVLNWVVGTVAVLVVGLMGYWLRQTFAKPLPQIVQESTLLPLQKPRTLVLRNQ